MRAKRALHTWPVVLGCGWLVGKCFASEWDELVSRNAYVEFVVQNDARIVNVTNIDWATAPEIRGLKVTEEGDVDWVTLGSRLTNVVCLRITSTATELPAGLFWRITNFWRLEYLHLDCRKALAIPAHVCLLTNLTQLRYLGIYAPAATNLDAGLYELGGLTELFLVVGPVAFPDGISRLRQLDRLEILGRRATPVRRLPADLPDSGLRRLCFGNVVGIDRLVPVLPPDLIELSVVRCQLRTVPEAWLQARKLEVVDFSLNRLTEFPVGLLRLPSLKLLSLDLNNITNVPPLKLADRPLKISLIANPIRHFAPENEPLLQRGDIEKRTE